MLYIIYLHHPSDAQKKNNFFILGYYEVMISENQFHLYPLPVG